MQVHIGNFFSRFDYQPWYSKLEQKLSSSFRPSYENKNNFSKEKVRNDKMKDKEQSYHE